MDKDNLKEVLRLHKIWLEDDENGVRADLSGANLSDANLCRAKDIYSFGPIGKAGRIGIAVKHETQVMFQLGCFWGTKKEALTAIKGKYGKGSTYAAQVRLAAKILEMKND